MLRLFAIQRVLLQHGLDELVFTMPVLRPFKWLRRLSPWSWFADAPAPRGVRLRQALEKLGPIYVKFGQILSTRQDMLPDDVAAELEKLQDKVAPFPGKTARRIIEQATGSGIDEIFATFDETPLASASIAQVHAATFKDGRRMIVKVVRPNIKKIIARDLGLIRVLAGMLERYSADARRLSPTSVVREFEKTLYDELDMMREAANASQLRRNFADSEVLYIPQVDWEMTSKNVLVMERVDGIPMNDISGLRRAGVDLQQLAENGMKIFFTQVFRDAFFHADLHPGNIMAQPQEKGRARIVLVDFGIMSSLSESDQDYLAANFLAFLNYNYRKVAELHIESGWVPPTTRVDELEFAIRTVCEPLFQRPMQQISIGKVLLRLFQTARRFNMVVLPQLVLLQKTLVNIEGVGRQLYPGLDIWDTARPVMREWMNNRAGVRALFRDTRGDAAYWLNRLPTLPRKVIDVVDQLHRGKLEVELTHRGETPPDTSSRHGNALARLTVGCALGLAALLLYLWGQPGWLVGGVPLLPSALSLASVWFILRSLVEL